MAVPRPTDEPESPGRRGAQVAEIVRVLREEIVAGAFPEGGALRQEALAERFGVSRMPVREALSRLVVEGLVSLSPNKGAHVTPLGIRDLEEITEMRVALETLALRLALPQITNAQIARAEALQAELEAAPTGDFGRLNTAFHKVLYEPCARPRLLQHIALLSQAADRYLCATVASLDYAGISHAEHHALLRACQARDEATAVSLLTRHIEEAGKALAERLEPAGDGEAGGR